MLISTPQRVQESPVVINIMSSARVCTWAYSPIGKLRSFCPRAFISLMTPRDEIAPWVTGISGSIYRKVRSWDEAKEIYNGRLATNAIQILR